MTRLFLTCLMLLLSLRAVAVIETYVFTDPELEQRYQQLSAELRCPKCQNQNIADSDAPIAQDLRKLLHQQLEAGANDEEILEYMVSRYGEFVRYRPSFSGASIVLWLAPVLLLLAGALVLFLALRSRPGRTGESGQQPLSAAEREQVQALLDAKERDS